MNNQERIENFKKFQESGIYHPLTCGNDSRHHVLVLVEEGDGFILKCPDCDYIQKWVPSFSLEAAEKVDELIEERKGLI